MNLPNMTGTRDCRGVQGDQRFKTIDRNNILLGIVVTTSPT